MSLRPGSFGTVASALAIGFFLAHCGDGDTATPPEDAGNGGDTPCTSNEECQEGWLCQGGVCAENRCSSDADCTGGWTCDLLSGQCEAGDPDAGPDPTDGGDGGHVDPPTDGGVPDTCSNKYDCPPDLICKASKCVSPSPNNACNADIDCPRGKICNFSKQCEAGCVDPRDCDGEDLCHPQKFVCESCSLTNPCPAGESCIAGACQVAIACTNAQDCVDGGADGAVCLGGFCGNCSGHGDCAVDPYKDEQRLCALDGVCKKVQCDDESCKNTLGERGYCDTASTPPSCQTRECLSDADCTQAGTVCDVNTFSCVGSSGSCTGQALSDCQTQCQAQFSQCNTATCNCGGTTGTPGSGAEGDPCIDSSECGTGLSCGLGICTPGAVDPFTGGACDPFVCALGGCVSSADPSYQCDAFGCIFSLLLGGGDPPCL